MNNFPEAFVPSVPCQIEIPTRDGSQQLHFKLTFDYNAISLAEEKLGLSMVTLNPKIWANMSAKTASILLWAAIQGGPATAEQENYAGDAGLKAIRSYIFPANVAPVIEAINEAYLAVQTPAVREFILDLGKKEIAPKAPAVEQTETQSQ